MLQKTLIYAFFLYSITAYASNEIDFPDSFFIKSLPCQRGVCAQFTVDGQEVGALLPALYKLDTYYFFDGQKQKKVTLKYTGHQFIPVSKEYVLNFDLYDSRQILVAKLKLWHEYVFYSFKIYAKDGKTKLLEVDSGLLGTEQTIFTGGSNPYVLAKLTRPLWTLSQNSDVKIVKKLALSSILDLNVFAAALAVYSGGSFYERVYSLDHMIPLEVIRELRAQLDDVAKKQGFTDTDFTLTREELHNAGEYMTQHFQQIYGEPYFSEEDTFPSKEAKLRQLIAQGQDIILSHILTPKEEQALLHFMRLQLT